VDDRFVRPDFAKPVDVVAQKRLVPHGATTKGMQLQALVDECRRRGVPLEGRRYVAFRDYPGDEHLDLLVLTAERVWPDLPRREGLRRLGRLAYPAFRSSMIGRVMFGTILGAIGANDVEGVWKLLPKAYSISGSVGGVKIMEVHRDNVLLHFFGIYTFLDAWHIGILEGAVEMFDRVPDVTIRSNSETEADVRVRWRENT
jgi:uncharacterized protein (TIGR02265 family)